MRPSQLAWERRRLLDLRRSAASSSSTATPSSPDPHGGVAGASAGSPAGRPSAAVAAAVAFSSARWGDDTAVPGLGATTADARGPTLGALQGGSGRGPSNAALGVIASALKVEAARVRQALESEHIAAAEVARQAEIVDSLRKENEELAAALRRERTESPAGQAKWASELRREAQARAALQRRELEAERSRQEDAEVHADLLAANAALRRQVYALEALSSALAAQLETATRGVGVGGVGGDVGGGVGGGGLAAGGGHPEEATLAMALRAQERARAADEALQQEVDRRGRAERQLRETEARLQAMAASVERRHR
jgi:hypothetical protein